MIVRTEYLSARTRDRAQASASFFAKPSAPLTVVAFFVVAVTLLSSCASFPARRLYPGSDTLLPGTAAAMNTPGYWISRHPAPDAPILDGPGIAAFNRAVIERKLTRDLAAWEPKLLEETRKDMEDSVSWIASLKVYDRSGRRVGNRFLAPIRDAIAASEILGDRAQYGFLARQTDLRVLPTDEPLYDGPRDPYIDNIQASSLEAGTALVVQAETSDRAWLFVATEKATGWLRSESAAIATRDDFLARYERKDALTVISAKADLWDNPGRTRFAYAVRMGTGLLAAQAEEGTATAPAAAPDASSSVIPVSMPDRDENGRLTERILWVSRDAVVEGFLPCTPRSIYEEAFKLLNAPYGWGGSFGEQDCSQFLCEVFATTGVALPRNSTKQAKAGVPLRGFAEIAGSDQVARAAILTERAKPAATLLRLPGHIMLYLGSVDGVPYAIHETFGYREKAPFGERIRLINRVVVSTLNLGAGTSVGSHLSRITGVILIENEQEPSATVAAAQAEKPHP
ncbi:MAG TPA: SH3 domain-containing protein [Treponemataceae bacterium]|nr:SH3 domain-containing protein [Treponemataceae bacterium]